MVESVCSKDGATRLAYEFPPHMSSMTRGKLASLFSSKMELIIELLWKLNELVMLYMHHKSTCKIVNALISVVGNVSII